MSDLQQLDEALYFLNNDDIIIEFNLKDSISNMIQKLKNALVRLIEKIQNFLSKQKDSNIKTTLNDLLLKAKDLLTRTKEKDEDGIDKKVFEEFRNEYENISLLFKMISAYDNFSSDLYLSDIKDYIKGKIAGNNNLVAYIGYEKDVIKDIPMKNSKYEAVKRYKPHDDTIACFIYDKNDEVVVDYKKFGYAELDEKLKHLLDSNNGAVLIEN